MGKGTLKSFNSSTDDFEVWKLTFQSFLVANDVDPTKEKDKARGILLSSLGLDSCSLLMSLLSPDKPETTSLPQLLQTLTEHFKPAPKAIAERFRFMSRQQKSGETVSQFLAELRKIAMDCKFTDLPQRLRDQFIFGLLNESTQKKVFTMADDVKLDEVLAVAIAQKAAEKSTSLVRGGSLTEPDPVLKAQVRNKSRFTPPKKRGQNHNAHNSGKQGHQQKGSCPNCGSSNHSRPKDCPHKNATCHSCGKKGHFASLCRSKSQDDNVGNIVSSVGSIRQSKTQVPIQVKLKLNGNLHTMEFDTGCQRSLLSEEFWRVTLKQPKLHPSPFSFKTYTNEIFRPLGQCQVRVQYNNQYVVHSFPVVKGNSLLGRDLMSIIQFDWKDIASQCNHIDNNSSLTLKAVLTEFADIFEKPKGYIKNFCAKILLKDDAVPKFMKARPLPFAIREKVDLELQEMESSGVLTKIEHSDWASPLVVVPKPNGKVRITGDFKNTVNSQLCVKQYPLADIDELFSMMAGGKKFSKLDGTNAYHQLRVDEASKRFLVINTHRGLYRYNVLPQGIASSPAIFQEFMDTLLAGIPSTGSYIDDGISSAATDEDHLERLKEIFRRMRNYNYYLSREKCQFMKPSLSFLGHVIAEDGIRTLPEKVAAIEAIQRPSSVTELKSFLGLVNFYGKFIPFLCDICEPLYRLTRDNEPWKWSKQCQSAFLKVKTSLVSPPTLVHHSLKLPIGISCDASSTGLGVVLFHHYPDGSERPIAYASKTLSDTERRYSQIEKEGLGIVYGIQKFYKYLCGRKFTLVTDHKPLLAIFGSKTNLATYVATRLHHWSLYLSQFQYDIRYRASKDHGNADALSRIPLRAPNQESSDQLCEFVHLIATEKINSLPVDSKRIRSATSKDAHLSKVLRFTENGWPEKLSPEDHVLQPYHTRRQEFSLEKGVIMWGIRVVIPTSLRSKVLEELHLSHMGIVKMKALARQFVWWPNIDDQIEHLCKSCVQCCEHRANPPSAPLHPWVYPEKPWQRLHVDLAGPFLDKMWFVLVDAHSKWPEVLPLTKDSTSLSVIRCLRQLFIRYGLPCELVTDNGVQFTSKEFAQFCQNNGIRHSRSSVYYPRSNGEAERLVQTFKRSMKIGKEPVEKKLETFLFTYRSTPHSTTGRSPSELLLGRNLRSRLHLLRPDQRTDVDSSQYRQREVYNCHVKSRDFFIGDEVWVRSHVKGKEKWILGKIIKQLGPVTFQVECSNAVIKRHVDHIIKAESTPFRQPIIRGTPGEISSPKDDVPEEVDDATLDTSQEETVLIPPSPNLPLQPPAAEEAIQPSTCPTMDPRRSGRPMRPIIRYEAGKN